VGDRRFGESLVVREPPGDRAPDDRDEDGKHREDR
jgi:hypothetical protein